MAEQIRQEEDLLAIRLDLRMAERGMLVIAELFRGRSRITEPVSVLLSDPALGFQDQRGARRSGPHFLPAPEPPTRLWELFDTARDHAAGIEPVWLQLAYGADLLAAYPWEAVFTGVVGRQLLRIPNFLRSSYRPETERPFAICAASPRAKGEPDWSQALYHLLGHLNDGASRFVALYFDRGQAPSEFNSAEGLHNRFPNLRIRIGHLPETAVAPVRERAITQRATITNPWLRWIADDLRESGAHAVHFLCPGYASDARGALAVPDSPLYDGDHSWARFVGAQEFAQFCDRLDVRAAGFSALGHPTWQEGIRLFANELSWIRPGPVLADFGSPHGEAIGRAYRALMETDYFYEPYPTPELQFSVHPDAIIDTAEGAAVRSISREEGAEPTVESANLEARTGIATEDLPREVTRALDKLSSARPKSPVRSARERGLLKAMEFVSNLTSGNLD